MKNIMNKYWKKQIRSVSFKPRIKGLNLAVGYSSFIFSMNGNSLSNSFFSFNCFSKFNILSYNERFSALILFASSTFLR